MGNEDQNDTQGHPESSSVMCIYRIINGANKIDTTKGEKVKKRDKWVKYLPDKAKITKENDMDNITFEAIINMIKTQVYTFEESIQRILTITTNPYDTWTTAKKGEMYTIPRS